MYLLTIALIAGCKPNVVLVEITVQLMSDNAPFPAEGIPVTLTDAGGVTTFYEVSNSAGVVRFTVTPGSYVASATCKSVEDGKRIVYNGSNPAILVSETPAESLKLDLSKVVSQQLILKELYNGGCTKDDNSGGYFDDIYFIIYNNSEFEADASDLVFGNLNPYNGQASNKYYADNQLIYENAGWVPAGGAAWYFKTPVTIPAFSQIVVAVFGAIDHTQTVKASVNLANADYYWMSNSEITAFTNPKYAVSDIIPTSHYLSGYQINKGNAWVISNTSPAFYMGKMPRKELEHLCKDTEKFDLTAGTNDIGWAVKFPQSDIIGALEVFTAAAVETSHFRFPASINTGYIALTNKNGYSIYRNVDKEATEALPENEGKLVYNYAGGTQDLGGSTDPSGIDAEASIAAGAHIIYLQTNDSGKDFHIRMTASLKK
ncbi:MAG: DUF4876 domain-containing protein [Bacteroidales bacterium]|nr:DUF4876 domain-containing protein [Bacteroidales bacterium]